MEITTTQTPAAAGPGASAQSPGGKAAGAPMFSQAMTGALQAGGGQAAAGQAAGSVTLDGNAVAAVLAAALLGATAAAQLAVVHGTGPADSTSVMPGDETATSQAGETPADSSFPNTAQLESQPLMPQIEQLLDQLFSKNGSQDTSNISLEDWQQAASELGALLVLLGIQPPPASPFSGKVQGGEMPAASAAAKSEVGELLLTLQQQLPEVSAKLAAQIDPQALTQAQLSKLQSLLDAQTGSKGREAEKASDSYQGHADVSGPAASSTSMLARLEASSIHLRAAVSPAHEDEHQQEQLRTGIDEPPGAAVHYAAGSTLAGTPAPAAADTALKVPVHRFAQEMTGMILQKLDITASSSMTEARLVLTPEHLGQVDVKLQIHNGQLTALFTADTPAAREALENQLGQLRLSLQNQGLQVDRLDVAQSQLQTSLSFGQQSQGGGGRSGGRASQQASDGAEEQGAQELESIQTVIRELGYGRAINEKA